MAASRTPRPRAALSGTKLTGRDLPPTTDQFLVFDLIGQILRETLFPTLQEQKGLAVSPCGKPFPASLSEEIRKTLPLAFRKNAGL